MMTLARGLLEFFDERGLARLERLRDLGVTRRVRLARPCRQTFFALRFGSRRDCGIDLTMPEPVQYGMLAETRSSALLGGVCA